MDKPTDAERIAALEAALQKLQEQSVKKTDLPAEFKKLLDSHWAEITINSGRF